jgi:dTDP-glucose 4,6-dehydratase
VEDHCRGIARVLTQGRVGQTYNIGGSNEWTNIGIVRYLCRLLDESFAADATLAKRFPHAAAAQGNSSETLIRFVTDRPGHDKRYAIDAGKIHREMGFVPAERFETGIIKTLNWYLAHESWWRRNMSGCYQ